MPSRFDRETEEEQLWADPLGPGTPVRHPRRRFLFSTLFVLLILVAGAYLIRQQVNRQAKEVSASVPDDILSSQQLWQAAINNSDYELFNTVLSASQPNWTAAQHVLFEAGLLQDRWPLGLTAVGSPQVTNVTVSPDLTAAEVVLEQQYASDLLAPDTTRSVNQGTSLRKGKGKQETIKLTQVLVFRRGRERWLYSPPRQKYWGDWQTTRSRYLTLSYPQREAEFAEHLLHDLAKDVVRMCTILPGINCEQDLHLHLRLDSNPYSLIETADPAIMLSPPTAHDLRLPAPSLVGMPVTEDGYQVLRHGYATHLLTRAIMSSVDYSCCENGLLFQALIDKQLSQFGLHPWPLDIPEQQRAFIMSPVGSVDMQWLWGSEPVPRPTKLATLPVYALVDYLVRIAPDQSIASMQRSLDTAPTSDTWLQEVIPDAERITSDVQRDWLHHLADFYEQMPAPLQAPNQDIQLLCENESGESATLVRYNPAGNVWTVEITDRPFVYMNPLPNDYAVLLQERQDQPDQSRVFLWRDGKETDVFGHLVAGGQFRTFPGSQDLVLFSYELNQDWTLFQLSTTI